MSDEPFRHQFRVRYHEVDAQQVVFNARWGEYVDVAMTEYTRARFGGVDAAATGMDWRLVRQVTEWKEAGRFDDLLEARVRPVRVGTSSFTLATAFHRVADGALLVTAETVYVAVDPAANRAVALTDAQRRALV